MPALTDGCARSAGQSSRTGLGIVMAMVVTSLLVVACVAQPRPAAATIVRSATSFDRSQLNRPDSAADVRAAGNLRGTRCCISGWVEFDISISTPGWYQIWTYGGALETIVDPPIEPAQRPFAYFAGGSGIPRVPDKVGNVWLNEGSHRIRFQNDPWYGFSDFRSFEVRPSDGSPSGSLAIRWPTDGQIFRSGECPGFELLYGGDSSPDRVAVEVQDRARNSRVFRQVLSLPESSELKTLRFIVPCIEEGFYRVVADPSMGTHGANPPRNGQNPAEAIKGFDYQVIDTTRPPSTHESATGHGIDVDCLASHPDYESGDSVVSRGPAGRARQSAATGWFAYQRRPAAARAGMPEPSWFAYILPGLVPGHRYRIDVAVPDDADRTFGIFLRERNQRAYAIGIAVDTGGPYATSNAMQSARFDYWARDSEPRIVFAPLHDGMRAACARIHIEPYSPGEPDSVVPPRTNTREFVSWYEEGINFIDLFGASDDTPESVARAADRWAGKVAEVGGTVLMPTALVYGGQLYPSRYNRMDIVPDRDVLRRIFLAAERFGLSVIPELHPRADELVQGLDDTQARRLLLVSKDGNDNYFTADGRTLNRPPYYNILLPRIQEWLVAMVGELADRYRDSPAFKGVSLRYMGWSNAALDNLVGIEWGYDDETIARFARESKTEIPFFGAADANPRRARSQWLATTGRARWEQWRCRQLTDLFRRLANRIRDARPDLQLFLHAFPADEERPFADVDTPAQRLRDAGLDPASLADLEDVHVIDSSSSYGRNLPDAVEKGLFQASRDATIILALTSDGRPGRYISAHRYLEATNDVIPPDRLGFPPGTRATWASLAAHPFGRQALEAYARQLAVADALMLGDGGNGYTFGNAYLPGFLADFTRLPAIPFCEVSPPHAAVTVRTAVDQGRRWIYAVNGTARAATAMVDLIGNGSIDRPSTGERFGHDGGTLRLELLPYELVSLQLSGTLAAQSKGADAGARCNR